MEPIPLAAVACLEVAHQPARIDCSVARLRDEGRRGPRNDLVAGILHDPRPRHRLPGRLRPLLRLDAAEAEREVVAVRGCAVPGFHRGARPQPVPVAEEERLAQGALVGVDLPEAWMVANPPDLHRHRLSGLHPAIEKDELRGPSPLHLVEETAPLRRRARAQADPDPLCSPDTHPGGRVAVHDFGSGQRGEHCLDRANLVRVQESCAPNSLGARRSAP